MTNSTTGESRDDPSVSDPLRRRRWLRRTFFVVISLVLIWVAGDFIYSIAIASRVAGWESSVSRDENGVETGCEAFSIGRGDTAVLLVHGINDSPHVYHLMAPRLAERGFACTAMRLPGFAMSVENYAKHAKRDEWVASVRNEVEKLRQNHRSVIIVAHSLGAAITIRFLQDETNSIDGLVLLAPLINVSDNRSPILSARTWHEIGKRLLIFSQVVENPYAIDVADPQYREMQGRAQFTPRQVVDETFALVDENQDAAHQIHVPVMIVLPGADNVVDRSATMNFFGDLASQHTKQSTQPDARHALPVDYGWQEMTDQIGMFIEEISHKPGAPNTPLSPADNE